MADLEKMFKELMGKFDKQTAQVEALRLDNEALKTRMSEIDASIPDLASTIEEISRRNRLAEMNPDPTDLQEFSGYKEGSIRKNKPEKLPFEGKKDCCPYCTEHGKASLLDLTKSGRWACRGCGKHWYEEALGQKYTKQLEKYIRGDETMPDPINLFRDQKDKDDRDEEISKLKADLDGLKDLIIKASLAKSA